MIKVVTSAVFDVDRTVLDGMSGRFFVDWLWRRGHLRPSIKLSIIRSVILYRTGMRPETEMVEVGVTCLAGLRATRVRELVDESFDEIIMPRVFKEAVEAVEDANRVGRFTVLASGSAQPVVDALAARLHAAGAVGTRGRIGPDGVYLPHADPPLCYADGKARLVEELLKSKGLRLEDAEFYTDNGPDIPMLSRVARPVAVNPDPVLSRAAAERGWPVLQWRTQMGGGRGYTGDSWPLKK